MTCIDNGRISSERLMFTIVSFIQSSSLLTSFMTGITLQDSWLAVLFSMVLYLPVLWLYRLIIVRFPGMNFLQVCELAFGKVVGKTLGVLYLWFFLTLAALNLTDLGEFSRFTLMEKTPVAVLIIMSIFVSTIAVRNGIRAVTWYSALYMVVSLVILVISILLVLNLFHFDNFLPMFDQPFPKYVQAIHVIMTIPFGELVVFLMITPSVDYTKRGVTRSLFVGFVFGALTTVLVVVRDTAVLGNTLPMFTLPPLVTLRMVHLGETLSRMEILFAIVLIMLLFIKITFLLYISVLSLAQLFGTKSFKRLTFVSAAFIAAYGQTLYHNQVEHTLSAQEIVPTVWMTFEFVIPLILILVATIRKLPAKKEA